MSKIHETLARLDSDSPVARELSALVATEKADTNIPLVDEAGYRMSKAFGMLLNNKPMDDITPLLKSSAHLLLVVAGEVDAEYRTMSKDEFEDYAVEAIAKADAEGLEATELQGLRTALDVAGVLFKGDNASKSFRIPLPIETAKAAEGGEGEGGEGDEAAPAEGDAPAGDPPSDAPPLSAEEQAKADEEAAAAAAAEDAPTGETEAAPAGDEATGDGDEETEVAKSASDDPNDFNSPVEVHKGWPVDMNGTEEMTWGADPGEEAPAASE